MKSARRQDTQLNDPWQNWMWSILLLRC